MRTSRGSLGMVARRQLPSFFRNLSHGQLLNSLRFPFKGLKLKNIDLLSVLQCYEVFISLIGWMRTHQAKLCLLIVKKNYASILYRTFYQMTFRIVIYIRKWLIFACWIEDVHEVWVCSVRLIGFEMFCAL